MDLATRLQTNDFGLSATLIKLITLINSILYFQPLPFIKSLSSVAMDLMKTCNLIKFLEIGIWGFFERSFVQEAKSNDHAKWGAVIQGMNANCCISLSQTNQSCTIQYNNLGLSSIIAPCNEVLIVVMSAWLYLTSTWKFEIARRSLHNPVSLRIWVACKGDFDDDLTFEH